MSLKTMIASMSEATGISNTNVDTRAQLVRYINTAGREIWNTEDIPGSTFEQHFTVPVNTTQAALYITLPWYCDEMRACRWSQSGQKIKLQDVRPRYQASPWRQPFLTWRVKQRLPLHTALALNSQLTFNVAVPQSETINITVSGPTTTTTNASETLTFVAGQLTATTTNQWSQPGPSSVTKDRITTADITIASSDLVNVGIIPARQEKANNIIIQVSDEFAPITFAPDGMIEVLYKLPYQELYFDGDTFGGGYLEDALVWRARANFEALKLDEQAFMRASVLAQKASDIIKKLIENQESEVEMTVNFAPDRYSNMGAYSRRGRYLS